MHLNRCNCLAHNANHASASAIIKCATGSMQVVDLHAKPVLQLLALCLALIEIKCHRLLTRSVQSYELGLTQRR